MRIIQEGSLTYRHTELPHLLTSADMRNPPRTLRILSHFKRDIERYNAVRLIISDVSTNCSVLSAAKYRDGKVTIRIATVWGAIYNTDTLATVLNDYSVTY